jgi:hypothetical protein
MTRYRPLLPRSSKRPTMSGRLRRQSLANSLPWLIRRTRALEGHLFSLAEQLLDEHAFQLEQWSPQNSGAFRYPH